MGAEAKYSICSICDIGCQLRTETKDGKVSRVIAHDNPMLANNICFKGVAAPSIHNHPDRLRTPLKRVGERGEAEANVDIGGHEVRPPICVADVLHAQRAVEHFHA